MFFEFILYFEHRIIKILPIVILLFSFEAIRAQDYVELVRIRHISYAKKKLKNSETSLRSWQTTSDVFIPLPISEKFILLTGFGHDYIHLEYQGNHDQKVNFHSLTAQLGGVVNFNDRWQGLFVAFPRIRSDLKNVDKEHYQWGGASLFTLNRSEKLKLKFGLYYNRQFFGNFVTPLLGMDWKINDKWRMFGVLPGYMNLNYQLTTKYATGLSYMSNTASYRNESFGPELYVREGDRFWGHIHMRWYHQLYLTGQIVLFAEIGHTLWRKYDLYDASDTWLESDALFQPVRNGLTFNVGLSLRVSTE